MGTLQRLPRIVGLPLALELSMTGRTFSAQEALAYGLVCPLPGMPSSLPASFEDCLHRSRDVAREIASKSPLVVRGIKRSAHFAEEAGNTALSLEQVRYFNMATLLSQDLGEAMAAIVEKRKPVFKGT